MFNRELTKQDFEEWERLLFRYSDEAISFAFDSWQRNGTAFPKPGKIVEIIQASGLCDAPKFVPCGECQDGYIRVFEGKTVGGRNVNAVLGAMKPCTCLENFRMRAA